MIHKQFSTNKICTYCSMKKQYVKRIQKQKKSYLIMVESEMTIAEVRDTFTVQRIEAKENNKVFLGLSCG